MLRFAGTWCYKPALRSSCCPQYTIRSVSSNPRQDPTECAKPRLDANEFSPSKSHRKIMTRCVCVMWRRTDIGLTLADGTALSRETSKSRVLIVRAVSFPADRKPGKTRSDRPSLFQAIHAQEQGFTKSSDGSTHKFQVRIFHPRFQPIPGN